MQIVTASQTETLISPKPTKPKYLDSPKAKAELLAEITAPAALEGEMAPLFDYKSIKDDKVRAKLQTVAHRIHTNIRVAKKNFLDNGRALLEVKDDLKHGEFVAWVEAEFSWSKRTAQNYMSIAQQFADDYPAVSYLPSPTLYRLASGKNFAALRSEVIAAAKAKQPIPAKDVLQLMSKVGGNQTAVAENADERRTAAAKAMETLRTELSDFDGFIVLVREAGQEFVVELNATARRAA